MSNNFNIVLLCPIFSVYFILISPFQSVFVLFSISFLNLHFVISVVAKKV